MLQINQTQSFEIVIAGRNFGSCLAFCPSFRLKEERTGDILVVISVVGLANQHSSSLTKTFLNFLDGINRQFYFSGQLFFYLANDKFTYENFMIDDAILQ